MVTQYLNGVEIRLKHPMLTNLIDAEEIGGGFITILEWFDGESCGYPQPQNLRY